MTIKKTVGTDDNFLTLLKKLDSFLDRVIPKRIEAGLHSFFNLGNLKDIFLMTDRGRAVGSAGLWCHDGEQCELIKVYVEDDYRGHGIAPKLIAQVEKLAREKGYDRIFGRIAMQQDSAIKMYNKLGYQTVPDEDFKYANRNKFPLIAGTWIYIMKKL